MDGVTPSRREQDPSGRQNLVVRGNGWEKGGERCWVKVRAADKKTPREGGGITGRNPPTP
jgi:hypothetical protein